MIESSGQDRNPPNTLESQPSGLTLDSNSLSILVSPSQQVDRMIESGEAEKVFQTAMQQQTSHAVADVLDQTQERCVSYSYFHRCVFGVCAPQTGHAVADVLDQAQERRMSYFTYVLGVCAQHLNSYPRLSAYSSLTITS